MSYEPGQDLIVFFDGEEYRGEFISQHHGRVMAKVLIDPVVDHGTVTSMLGVQSIVNVRDTDVRPTNDRPEPD